MTKIDILKLAGQVASLRDMTPTHHLYYCPSQGKLLDAPDMVEVKYVVDNKVIFKNKWGAGVLAKDLFEKHAQQIREADNVKNYELVYENGQGEFVFF